MGVQTDPEAYQKGYDDAMRAASQVSPVSTSTTVGTAGTKAKASGRHDMGGKVQRGIGTAFGWLILFPVFMGLMFGAISFVVGLSFTTWALAGGGLAFLFALFAGLAIVGWRLFIALWPVLLVGGIIAVAVVKLVG